MFGLRYFAMEAATGGDSGAGGGSSPPAAPAPSAAPAATPAASPAGSPTGAPAPSPTPPAAPVKTALGEQVKDPDPHAWMPAKHRVLKEDGSLDVEASARKNAEAYGALSKRLGSGDLPPASPGEYKIKAPAGMEDSFQPDDPVLQQHMTKFHAAGLTQAQVDVVMEAHFAVAKQLTGAHIELQHDTCVETLAKVWTDPVAASANYRQADRALKEFAGERYPQLAEKYGNDPDVVWLLANVGKELKADSTPNAGQTPRAAPGMSPYQNDPARTNPMDPRHAEVSRLHREFFERQAK